MSILVVGSVAFDSVKTPYDEAEESIGGSATYFSAAASFYTPVDIVAVVGRDFPRESLQFLSERHVDLSGLEVADGQTFRWAGEYEPNMNDRQTLDTQLNVFADFHPNLTDRHREQPFVFLANIDPELQGSVLHQTMDPKLIVCDTMDFWISGKREALLETLTKVDVLIINDSEARELVDDYNLARAANQILDLGPRAVVIKRGEHGATLITQGTYFSVPAFPVLTVIDPTGAGDSFAGGFVGYLAKSQDTSDTALKNAMVHGSVMASFNVEDFSIRRLESLTQHEMDHRYERFIDMLTL
ncbi:MAG: PfkB family carbohydrate kinase [Candidatus Latescibacteria bacterium]|nr:PfkB family carbohydrate kinase [Candidatus Latescibacterota bacterium]